MSQTDVNSVETKLVQTLHVPLSTFNDHSTQTNNETTEQGTNKLFCCNYCGKPFTFELFLQEHMKTCHRNNSLNSPVGNFMALPVGFPSNFRSWPPTF